MRKRRVLAVLLALSLVVSGNGITVLAAETDADQPVVTTQEETTGTNELSEESETPGTKDESEESETPGTAQEPEESGTPETTEDPEDQEDPDAPKEDEAEEQPVEDEAAEPVEEQPVEDEAEEPAKEQEEPDETASALPDYVSRIVTFTDDTGMQVTYDANASTQYVYKVENGVLTAVVTRTTVSDNTIEKPVEFTGNVELKQPEEGEKYTSIASSVFGGNQKITYVKLPAGVETIAAEDFKGCTALKGVYLPASVNKIENSAFEGCTAMTQISVPKAVTTIGESVFKGDVRLYLVYIKDADYSELKSIGAEAFSGCTVLSHLCSHSDFVFPIKLETIGASAFRDCKAIKMIDFSANKNLKAIGANVFNGCTALTDLTPGRTLKEIPEGAFAGCIALININFGDGESMSIGREAFKGCYNLKQLVLPQSIVKIDADAFQGCKGLRQVEIEYNNIDIAKTAFPADAKNLVIVAKKDSNGNKYALENNFKTPDENAFYQYIVEDVNGTLMPLEKNNKGEEITGKYIFPGGSIWVCSGTQTKAEENVNMQNQKQGVKSGETCYIYRQETSGYTFIAESLRCNGKPVQKKDGKYYFEMPAGGAVITAEFRANTPDKINGQKVTVEFSNGTPLRNGETDGYGYLGVELKVGQTSRMFLLDEDGNPIPAQKLSNVTSDNVKVAKIDKNGVITAAGTGGKPKASATVHVEVKGGDGELIPINRMVEVTTAEAESIILKASDYSSFVKIEGKPDGIQTASIKKNIVSSEGLKFKLKANVYDGEEGISKDLTWTTSNAKVAVLKSNNTTAADPVNEISVLKGCEGEATITVTAQNPADSEKEKVTQKFVVRVYEEGFKLAGSTVTVNPRMSEGGTVELISAYGMGLENARIDLYEENSLGSTKFTAAYDPQKSSSFCKTFHIKPVSDTIKNGTYKVRVGVNGDKAEKNLLPLTITVKEAMPKPTVKFNTNKAKFNLFYTNGGTNDKGEQMSLLTEITKLDGVKVENAVLEPLTQKEDDKLFTENFVIDKAASNFAQGKVVIKRSGKAMQYTKQKKAAVTGYLVLYFEGYDDSAVKKVKVTMPTCTTAPSWALRTTKGTYRADADMQSLSLVLYDKRSKTKEDVVLDETYSVTAEATGDVALLGKPEIRNEAVAVRFLPQKGSMKLLLHNPAWDLDQNGKERVLSYTYSVSVSNAKPTVKTNPAAVSLNQNYPEKAAQFTLVSNLGGLEIEKSQTFTPVVTKTNADEIAKLQVTYKEGQGSVSIKSGQTVKKGTYKFECNPSADEQGLKKVVLTVKVVDEKPSVKFGKGSLQLNTVVFEKNSLSNNSVDKGEQQTLRYQETSERTFKVNRQPEGYTLAPVGNADDSGKTTIVCTTRNKAGAERYFNFEVEEDPAHEKDDVLKVSLNDRALTAGTYSFRMTPRFLKEGMITVSAQPVTFQVKVINATNVYLTASPKGKINLVNREGEESDKNGIVYTPALKNIVGEIEAVKIYDAGNLEEESKYFDICMITEEKNKNAGKFYVTPKKIAKTPQNDGDPIEYTYVELENNRNYPVRIWVQVKNYAGDAKSKGGVLSNPMTIKTAQVLPKVTLNRTSMDVYLSTKNYDADFVVKPKEGSVGTIEDIYFGEKDEMANDSFTLIKTPQADGSMKVTVHLKEAVSFANGANSSIKFYVKYKGQGTNTSATATAFTMKIRVN